MQYTKYTAQVLLALSLILPACGGDDDDDSPNSGGSSNNGGSSGSGNTSGSSNSGGSSNTGGSSTGTGGSSGGMCPAGTVDYYDEFYAVPDCAAYYDCIIDVACESSPESCEPYRQALASSYCVPEGTMLDGQQLAQGCMALRQALIQQFPSCAD